MRKTLTLLITLLLVLGIPASARAAAYTQEQPVVRAVLFWTSGCPYCEQALTSILPPIQDKYRDQLSIRMIELVGTSDVNALYSFGSSLGLSKEQVAVPFLVIDRTTLIGVDQIQAGLPGLVEKYLAAGGIGYPDFPIIIGWLSKGIDFNTSDFYLNLSPASPASTNNTGMILAWVIMGFMGLAVVLAIVLILRAFQGKPLGEIKGWIDYIIPILALVGLGASIYLTYVEVTHTRALCGPVGDCNAVQSSPYAKLFGVLPIGLLGAIGYVAILVAWVWRRVRHDALAKLAGPAMYGMALFGTLFSIYLTYLELFVIHAVCIWCLSSAVIITALMLLNLPPITHWVAIADEED